jgi:UDP-N-acetyl-D-mannosaminuronic acid dehydrogenase
MTAEIAKVVENTYRDVNIAFANEVALICESLGVNVYEVRKLVNTLPNDPTNPATNPHRNMHIPGAGVGGHCLPKDPWLLKYGLDNFGEKKFEPFVIVQSRERNHTMPQHMIELLKNAFNEINHPVTGSKVCVLGYAFIANSDDTRNTPSQTTINLLKENNIEVVVHDPYVKRSDEVDIIENFEEAVSGVDAILIITNHKMYYEIDLDKLKKLMNKPIIIDGRNIFDGGKCRDQNFIYYGVGKGI